ncbi:chloroplast carotene biosynthesis related protein [Dunaliella salina]|uniref:Chloroplast carotene biosynthesis related protein n=1 Tax=Dunaliella salina TaxID=3046 RepID=A0ABQ7FXX2_DUNSA|nr:chloroplast carotene biosynthesis related protein [Dunaliella salina]|eukprot:KAF5827210.1 chloroplast carotene biosynthesis related protein [Dunaliella salina]
MLQAYSVTSSRVAAGASVRPANPIAPRPSGRSNGRKHIAVRAEDPSSSPQPAKQQSATVFYGGVSYTEEQWKEAVARNEFAKAPSTPETPSNPNPPTVQEVMGFSGAPEIINGRLAMLGFVAALGAELSSGDSVVKQISEEPTLISLTFILFSAASLVPAFARTRPETIGPFNPQAEMTNGRAAMIGFAAMLILENIRGVPLF